MKKILGIILCVITQLAVARMSWDEATLVEHQLIGSTGVENVFQCTYQLVTGGTYRMSIRYKGFSCPQSIVVNIESGKWKERR